MRKFLFFCFVLNLLSVFGQTNDQNSSVNGSRNEVINSSINGKNINIGGIQNISSISNYGLSKKQYDSIINFFKETLKDSIKSNNLLNLQNIELINIAINKFIDSINLLENSFEIKSRLKDSLNNLKLEQIAYKNEIYKYRISMLEQEIELQKLKLEGSIKDLDTKLKNQQRKDSVLNLNSTDCLENTILKFKNLSNKDMFVFVYKDSKSAMALWWNAEYKVTLYSGKENTLYSIPKGVYFYVVCEKVKDCDSCGPRLLDGQIKINPCQEHSVDISF